MSNSNASREKVSIDKRNKIYDKTDGHCHICNKKLARKNYGVIGGRGSWEVDHLKPISKGGKNHLNNYLPACISCNRKRGNTTTKSARLENGQTKAPLSKQEKLRIQRNKTFVGTGIGALIGAALGPAGLTLGAITGAVFGSRSKT